MADAAGGLGGGGSGGEAHGFMLANKLCGGQPDASFLLGKAAFALLEGRVEAKGLVLGLPGEFGAAMGAMDQAAFFKAGEVAANAGCGGFQLGRQFIHGSVAVAQQHLEDSLCALIGLNRHEDWTGTSLCGILSTFDAPVDILRVCRVAFTSTPTTKTCRWGFRGGKSHFASRFL